MIISVLREYWSRVVHQLRDVYNVRRRKYLETSETYSPLGDPPCCDVTRVINVSPMQIFDEEHNVWFLDNGGAMLAVLHAATPIRHLW